MAIKSAKDKGATGERELAAMVYDHLGVRLKRNLEQTRGGGYDLVVADGQHCVAAFVLDQYAIEVKRAARLRVTDALVGEWWEQARKQAARNDKIPVLAYKPDRQAWRVMLPMDKVRIGDSSAANFAAVVDFEGFCYLVREAI